MGWGEEFTEKQAGLGDLISQVQQKREDEAASRGSGLGGFLSLLGGAALMLASGGAAAPIAGAMMTGGIGLAGSGISKMAGGR